MKRLLSLCVALVATIWLWAGNVITYTAPSQLTETTSENEDGFHVNAFNVPISSHTFSAGTGTITFSGELTTLGYMSFGGCYNLTSIIIPESVTSIGDYALASCSELTSFTIPESVTSIGNYAFDGCRRLTSITIPESVRSIGNYAFSSCGRLTSITIPESVTNIGIRVFHFCSGLTSVNLPENMESLGEGIFYYCSSLTSVSIPENVTSIGDFAFANCSSLMSITIPTKVTSLGKGAFGGCRSLTSITLPTSVSSIGEQAFNWCSNLTSSINIPNGVTTIGSYAFGYCSHLTTITIPNSVTSIGDFAFYSCSRLTTITCEAINPPTVYDWSSFSGIPKDIPVYVPCGSVAAYQIAEYWSDFTNIQEIVPEPTEYTRSTTPGRYGTICLPKAVAHDDIEGGVFFNIVYAVTNTNMDITGILMEEETGDLVAGKPYIFRATADELVLPYTGEAVANPLAANGLVGNLSETPLDVLQGMYVLSNNQIRKLNGGTATAGQNRAYIDLTNVAKLNYVPSAAPNRVMLNVEGSSEATDLENIKSDDVQKVIRDGQLLIIRDGKIYNVLGMPL